MKNKKKERTSDDWFFLGQIFYRPIPQRPWCGPEEAGNCGHVTLSFPCHFSFIHVKSPVRPARKTFVMCEKTLHGETHKRRLGQRNGDWANGSPASRFSCCLTDFGT